MKNKYRAVKERTIEIISKAEEGDRVSRIFDWTIMILIALSVISIILESFSGIYSRYYRTFRTFEVVTVVIFTVEYLLRIWTADLLYPEAKHAWLKYILSFMAIIDLLAILPFYLPFFSADLRFLRVVRLLRLLRLLRIFKLGRYFDALQIIVRVIRTSAAQLVMSVVICFFVILVSSILMYYVENPMQPEAFPNVMASFWWAICTLTTVGYGDVYPITVVGKILTSVISLVGIGIIAIPTGIIAAGFDHVISGEHEKEEKEAAEQPDPKKLIDDMSEEELVAFYARASCRLKEMGYSTTVVYRGENEQ